MSYPEILMLRQSDAFARRLLEAARALGDSKYRLRRRVNWSHRYHSRFYQDEAALFTANAAEYVSGRCSTSPTIDDVFKQRVGIQALLMTIIKVSAHWLFLILGSILSPRLAGFSIYRKAYVDDIELVYDVRQPSVLRAVYPFPVSIRRQARYIADLTRRRVPWIITGNPYAPSDVVRLLFRRDLESMRRMESRAQIRDAFRVAAKGFEVVQLSDEFNLGSLDFSRALARRKVRVVNSAHGAGKYLPMHAFDEFYVLTGRQQEYYFATRPCRYFKRVLNERAATVAQGLKSDVPVDDTKVNFVFISGTTSYGVGEESLVSNEVRALRCLASLANDRGIRLLYRPHPNRHDPVAPEGFTLLTELGPVNGRANTLFASYASTCQIDPAFKGRKVLIRGELIAPETWFDDTEEMMDLEALTAELRRLGEAVSESRQASAEAERACP